MQKIYLEKLNQLVKLASKLYEDYTADLINDRTYKDLLLKNKQEQDLLELKLKNLKNSEEVVKNELNDLEQNGWVQTMMSIGVSTAIGIGFGALSDFVSDKIQIGKLTSNAHTNKSLMKKLGIKHSFNKNGRSITSFTNSIKKGQWTSKLVSNSLSSGISSNTTNLLFGIF